MDCTDRTKNKKNRPQECSSKIPVKFGNTSSRNAEYKCHDPRFDNLCGTFNHDEFSRAYKFIDDIKTREKQQLTKMLKTETQPENKEKIKHLLRRMANQELDKSRRNVKKRKKKDMEKKLIQYLNEGRKPYFPKKSEMKLPSFVESFEELKGKGKLEKYMRKKTIKKVRKDKSGT